MQELSGIVLTAILDWKELAEYRKVSQKGDLLESFRVPVPEARNWQHSASRSNPPTSLFTRAPSGQER